MKKLFIIVALALLPILAGAQNEPVRRRTNTNQRRQQPVRLCPDNNHPHVIDLGLPSGTKWACCNVGASKPEEYGDYFAWGETSTKSNYDWSNYRWCNGAKDKLTKYNTKADYGTVDNKTQLDLEDDAARANWHGSWRMPTNAEMEELKANCRYTWTTVNGVKGGKLTSRSNGRSIFLPADHSGKGGSCWSSSLYVPTPYAHYLYFQSYGVFTFSFNDRNIGQSVRPVLRN